MIATADPQWLQSPWDHEVHLFRSLTEVAATAVCSHSAPTARLTEPLPGARRCIACLLIHGGDLADTHDAPHWRA